MFDQSQRPTSPATAHHSSIRRTARGVGRRIVVIGAMVATLVAGNAGTAQAWGYTTVQGSAGNVSLPRINVSDIYTNYGGRWAATLTIDSTIGPLVSRSPATTGAQDVLAVYYLEMWNGSSWSVLAQSMHSGRIPAGYGAVRLPRASFLPNIYKGYYRISWVVAWASASTGAALGGGFLTSNATSDFACITTLRPCQVSAGNVRVGRLYQLGGGW